MYHITSGTCGLDEMMGEMVAVICGVVINYVQQEETNKVLLQNVGYLNIQYLSLQVLKRLLSHHRQCTSSEVQLLKEVSLLDISKYPIGEYVWLSCSNCLVT